MVTATRALEQRVRALDAFLAVEHRRGPVQPAAWLVVVPFAADGTPDVTAGGPWPGAGDARLADVVRRALRATAPDTPEPHVVVVGDDPAGLGLPMADVADLRVSGDEVRCDGRRVDVLWRRTKDPALAELLARPVARGRVRVANALGAEAAARVVPELDDLVRRVCGEEPVPLPARGVPSVACWDGCGWTVVAQP